MFLSIQIVQMPNKEGLRRLPSRFNPGFKKPVVEGRAIHIKGNGCGGWFAPKEASVRLGADFGAP